jgi:hypothetical protein
MPLPQPYFASSTTKSAKVMTRKKVAIARLRFTIAQKRLREFKGAELGTGQPNGIALENYLKQQLANLVKESPKNLKEQDQLSDLIQNSLPKLAAQPFPFASPFYWSGFIAQGLA